MNISKIYDSDAGECETVLGNVFTQFRDTLLFVAASSSDSRASNDCLAALARVYQNVTAAGGVNDDDSGAILVAPQVASTALRLVARWPWLSSAGVQQLVVDAYRVAGGRQT